MSGALPLFICTIIRFTSSPDSGGTGDLVRGLGTERNRVSAIIQARLGFKCSFEKDDDGDATVAVDCVNGWRCGSIWHPVTGADVQINPCHTEEACNSSTAVVVTMPLPYPNRATPIFVQRRREAALASAL
jgi:hypothetical protein